ncbi:hypothetical protein GBAR_LOCUS28410 [Geodia barretti]|uniref:Uncharacterized protein n=3 Tax=Geodia barretti TaxID=519541 RepID=A0AA35XID5_GEOBA|nr:hypothetical protein GBAR_LOCUS28410 [Geodia barretti]
MVTGVKEKKTIPGEEDIRGPMPPNKQSRVEKHAALVVLPFKALQEEDVISGNNVNGDPDSDDGEMTSVQGADHSPEFISPQTVSSTVKAEDSGDQPEVGSEVCTGGSAHQMKTVSPPLSQETIRDILGCNGSLQPVEARADEKHPNEAPARKTQTRYSWPQKLPSKPIPSQPPPETESQQPQEKSSCPPHAPAPRLSPRPGGKENYCEKVVSQGPDSLWDLRLRSLHRSYSV